MAGGAHGHNKITAVFLFGLGLGLVIAWMVEMVVVGWESFDLLRTAGRAHRHPWLKPPTRESAP
jgi:hypothetical protein